MRGAHHQTALPWLLFSNVGQIAASPARACSGVGNPRPHSEEKKCRAPVTYSLRESAPVFQSHNQGNIKKENRFRRPKDLFLGIILLETSSAFCPKQSFASLLPPPQAARYLTPYLFSGLVFYGRGLFQAHRA